MDLHDLLRPHLGERLAAVVADAPRDLSLQGPAALQPFVLRAAAESSTVLAVTSTAREADDLAADLGVLMGPEAVAVYPAWETLPHERLSPRSDTVGKRLAVLRRLAHPGTDAANGPLQVVVAPHDRACIVSERTRACARWRRTRRSDCSAQVSNGFAY